MSRLSVIVTFTTVLLFAAHAAGALQEFENKADWEAAVGDFSTVDFSGYPDNTPINDQWSHLGITFTDFNVVSGPAPIVFPEDGWGLQGFIEIHFEFDTPMSYIAADFPGAIAFDLYLDDELVGTTGELGGSGFGLFGGAVSDEMIDRVRIYDPNDDAVALDDLRFGPPIPAPGALAPFALLLGARSRRRRRDNKPVTGQP